MKQNPSLSFQEKQKSFWLDPNYQVSFCFQVLLKSKVQMFRLKYVTTKCLLLFIFLTEMICSLTVINILAPSNFFGEFTYCLLKKTNLKHPTLIRSSFKLLVVFPFYFSGLWIRNQMLISDLFSECL